MQNSRCSRLKPVFTFSLLYIAISFLLRIILWIVYGLDEGVTALQLPSILSLGIVNDFLELIYLSAPLTFYLIILPDRIYNSKFHQKIILIFSFLLLFGLIYLQAVEFFFFDEFNARFNLVAVDYLMYPTEVLINLWESYPIMWFLFGNFALTLVGFYFLKPKLEVSSQLNEFPISGKVFLMIQTILIVLLASFFSTDTLTTSSNRVANEISANGISSLFLALRTEELDYHLYYRTLANDKQYKLVRKELHKYGGGKFLSKDKKELNRSFSASKNGFGKLNVVILSEESFGAGFVGAYGDTRNLTPNFDRLSKTGMMFKNAYATGTRTVRGLEAIITSFPPIPSESILKRPGNENVANWGEVMKSHGYHSSFLYGGYGLFDNMNYFFGNNGFELSDRTDVKEQTFTNIWGVCDEDLFNHAIKYYDKIATTGKPFFSLIMSTSNHKPYTFPEGIPGVPTSGGGREAGVRYADYAIGKFFEEAPKHDWYKNTLFVVIADHDARVYGRSQVPIERYRIPLVLIAPDRIKPQVIDNIISQIDLAPTVLKLLGLDFTAPFYGRDVLDPNLPSSHPIMMSHNHNVALLDGDKLAVLGLKQSATLFSYNSVTYEQEQLPPNQKIFDRAAAYYQSAFELFKEHRYVLPEQKK